MFTSAFESKKESPHMASQASVAVTTQPFPEPVAAAPARPRTWPPMVLLGIFWTIYSVLRWTDLGAALGFLGWLILLGSGALTTLLFAIWWLAASRVRWAERLPVFGTALAAGVAAGFLVDKTIVPTLLVPGIPLVLTIWVITLVVLRNWPSEARRAVLAGVLLLSWTAFTLIRTEGMWGDGQFTLFWRWSLTPEQVYIAEGEQAGGTIQLQAPKLQSQEMKLQPGDWPEFRGPKRDSNLHHVRIPTDWDTATPKQVWKRRIGPAWSSIIVVGDRLFTQEQFGKSEAVVCLDAGTGRTLWSHKDEARHEDVQGGVGPRATPTFADGQIFALGGTGILNCLDAATGEHKWHRDITADSGARVPMWGFSSSPLIIDKRVVVFVGGDSDKSLLAYHAKTGKPAWSAAAGKVSYSSPHLMTAGDKKHLLFVSDRGLFAYDPSSGTELYSYGTEAGNPGVPRATQPQAIGAGGILFDSGPDVGTILVDAAHQDGSWTVSKRWISRQLKPSFNDFVLHDKSIYGFDGRMLTCIDLQTGKRRWKEGRYGSGQVLLLGDQALLMVVTEEGELVLVAANPEEHQELARFQAIKGKTWSHPVIAHGRLYIRNAEWMACYKLQPLSTE
jgi:outer membrane protein assembly factor BamB